MTIDWHCRTCNEKGMAEISIKDLIRSTLSVKEVEKHILARIQMACKHECEDPNIGIRLHRENREDESN